MNRFINPLIDAFNEIDNHRLPKYIMLFPDRDLMSFLRALLGDSFRAARIIGAAIHYLVQQINILIDCRRQDLVHKHAGSCIKEGYPKVVWIRMIKRLKLELSASQELCSL